MLQYLHDPNAKVDKVFGGVYSVMHKDELYRRIAEDLLTKCLESDQANMVMGEVHGL